MRKFKNLSNQELVDTINKRFANNQNDDDYVKELFRRSKKEDFLIVPEYNTYKIITKQ
tara:strand:+ start:1204 stop:1377 length:174 start_codon:yes stop_codon:yes gene_type:complete